MGQFWTKDVVNALKCKWNANLVRAAMGVQAEYGGYLGNKAAELKKVRTVSSFCRESFLGSFNI